MINGISSVLDLITDIASVMGWLPQGETPNASEAAQVFLGINRRLDQWNSQAMFIYAATEVILGLTANKQSYQIGPGALDFNLPSRPFIRHASMQLPGSRVRLPLELIGQADWNAIEERALTGDRTMKLYCDYKWPVANLNFWPTPSGGQSLFLYTWTPLTQYAALTDIVDFPPGYLMPFEYQVAMDLLSAFNRQMDPATIQSIVQNAAQSSAQIQQLNASLLLGVATGPVQEMPQLPPQSAPMQVPQPQGAQ